MVHHGAVVESLVEKLVSDLRACVHGELSSRNHVVDGLLDLRLASRDNPLALAVIDRLLGELPGRTTVANAWWLEALLEIERADRSVSVATAQTVVPPSQASIRVPSSAPPASPAPPLPRRRPRS